MSRTDSAGQHKFVGRPIHDKPQEGSKLRAVYNAFRRGETLHHLRAGVTTQLRDFYGMEFEKVGHTRNGGGMRLTGEWEGPYFVPLERIVQEDGE